MVLTMVTIFRNIFDKLPNYITVEQALERIKTGRSKQAVEEIRNQLDKERADKLKMNLPSVCFSGKFTERKDDFLQDHSGYIVLDFDNVSELRDKQTEIISHHFIYACWVSPRGNGLKALVKIADTSKHREHFQALKEVFPEIDNSGINVSRVCFESYDPEIYISQKVKPFTKFLKVEKQVQKETVSDNETYKKILAWLTNRGDAFRTGERNTFIFKLAAACCRFGVNESETKELIFFDFVGTDATFAANEAERAIKSAYRGNNFGTAVFEKEILIDKKTRSEVHIDEAIFDLTIKPKDVIFGEDVKEQAINIYKNGYERVLGIGCELDDYFKFKAGELTCLTGIGNYGKSTWLAWYLIVRAVKFGEKFAIFSPENNPAEEFYHDLTEIYLGQWAIAANINQMKYESAYDFVSKHIFYVYPKELAPTPDYIKERFLELIIKEKVKGCIIDPFNQLSNDYNSAGGRSDKYLESFLSDSSRFAQINSVYFVVVAHPHKLRKEQDGNYPCPDVFDLADGAMWNNKMDNIIVYHRPNHQKDPNSSVCELHSKKIRRQKQVGKKGVLEFEYYRTQRRYYVNGRDVLGYALVEDPEINDIPF
jgi:hypothetical protein